MHVPLRSRRSLASFAALSLVTGVAGVAGAVVDAAAPAAGATGFTYTSFSYGSRVLAGSSLASGPSATSGIGCTDAAPLRRTDDAAGAADRSALVTGNVSTTASTSKTPADARSTSTVHGLRMFGGLLSSAVIEAQSSTTETARGPRSHGSTTFSDLRIGGHGVGRTVAPNTRRSLPGIGYVILNQQTTQADGSSSSLIVDAVHVVVTQPNRFGLSTNSNVLVGHAMSGLSGPVAAFLGGEAYGTSTTASPSAQSDPKFKALMPCLGTGGRLHVITGAQVAQQGVVTTGTDRNTARGTTSASSAAGTLTATVHGVDLLSGIVSATEVTAVAQALDRNGKVTTDDHGSSFDGLSVPLDKSLGSSIPPNTEVPVPGVGTLYLHRVLRSGRSIEVRMIELIVTHSNNRGLPVGDDIRIGVAKASVR